MGRIKQTNFHKTTISKMMKSLAILAISLAAVQARMLNDDTSASALDLGGKRRLADEEYHPSANEAEDEDYCLKYPKECGDGRRLAREEDPSANGNDDEEEEDEGDRRMLNDISYKDRVNVLMGDMFRMFDVDGSGDINEDDFDHLLYAGNLRLVDSMNFMSIFGKPYDGTVTRNEFVK